MPKDFESFFSRINGRKVPFLGEFSLISGSNRSLAVCTTVVQLGILRLMNNIANTTSHSLCHMNGSNRKNRKEVNYSHGRLL